MKTNSCAPAQLPVAAVSAIPEVISTLDELPPGADCARVLLALDVPQAALAQVQADWSLITDTQNIAPDLVPELVAAALSRLQHYAHRVAGVAVLERIANPLVDPARRVAARMAA